MALTVELIPFHNEIDVLRARVELMAGHVDRHIVAEADLTHQGQPKPLYLDGVDLPPAVDRWRAWLPEGYGDAANWKRENEQRDMLAAASPIAALGSGPDTLMLSCDCDEIVDPTQLDLIRAACQRHGPVSLGMRMIYYGTREHPAPWIAPKAFLAGQLRCTLSDLRLNTRLPVIADAGWHLSYLGGLERRRTKVEAFAHAENRSGLAWERVAAAVDGPNGEHLVPFDPAELPPVLRDLVLGAS